MLAVLRPGTGSDQRSGERFGVYIHLSATSGSEQLTGTTEDGKNEERNYTEREFAKDAKRPTQRREKDASDFAKQRKKVS